MKNCAFLLILALQVTASGQQTFSKQIADIVNDTSHRFKRLRGAFDSNNYVFRPRVAVEGTINGKIFTINDNAFYGMEVANSDSMSAKAIDSLLRIWVDKLTIVLGKKFSMIEGKAPAGLKAYYEKGFEFHHGNLSLSVDHWKRFHGNQTIHLVSLFFAFKPPD